MIGLKKITEFYVYSNLHVSLAVACFTLISGFLFDKNVETEALFLGCSTFIAYHFIRYMNRTKYGKTHLLDAFSNTYKNIIGGLLVLTIGVNLYLLTFLEVNQTLRLLPFGVLTLLYGVSFIKLKEKRYSIRYIPGLKIFIIASVWAGVVVFFPLEFNSQTGLYFLESLLFVVVLTLPFDIRDVQFDKENVTTLPIVLGLPKTKWLGTLFLLLSVAIHYYTFGLKGFFAYLFIALILVALLWKSTTNQSKYYASFWVEGIPIFYVLLWWGFSCKV